MRPMAIGLTGLVVLVLIFTGIAYLQLVLLCLALLLCGTIALGFRWQGHKARAFWIPTARGGAVDGSADKSKTIVNIEGRAFSVRSLPPRLEFRVCCRNMQLPAAVAIVAIGALFACFFGSQSLVKAMNPDSPLYFEFYALCYLMAVLLVPAIVWLSESALMRAPGITICLSSSAEYMTIMSG